MMETIAVFAALGKLGNVFESKTFSLSLTLLTRNTTQEYVTEHKCSRSTYI